MLNSYADNIHLELHLTYVIDFENGRRLKHVLKRGQGRDKLVHQLHQSVNIFKASNFNK
jgi:hypothetical protein